jgi:hypothetical protein
MDSCPCCRERVIATVTGRREDGSGGGLSSSWSGCLASRGRRPRRTRRGSCGRERGRRCHHLDRCAGPKLEGEQMHCPRCHGLMMTIRMREAGGGDAVSGWRCLLCGEATDPGIEANRKAHGEPIRNRARPPGSVLAGSGRSKRKMTRH